MELSNQDRDLLNAVQKDFPLHPEPFKILSDQLGIPEQEIIARLNAFQQNNVISRFGAVFDHQRAGASTLVALAVPEHELEPVAERINLLEEVNHNYQREHAFNLWFVVNGCDQSAVDKTITHITTEFDYPLLDLPMIKGYHIDLGFPLW
ncbi:MAG: Lrp/AsnC family transcriptional regulator [Porticoccus sp.]